MLTIAWKFIRFDRAKSIGVVTAVVISIFLIGQQLSLLSFLMGLMGNLVGNAPVAENDIWVIERQSNNINNINVIDSRFVQEIASLSFAANTFPVVVTTAQASFLDGKTAVVTLVGSDIATSVVGPIDEKIMSGRRIDLLQPYAVSAELFSTRNWGTTVAVDKAIEINGKSAKIGLVTKNAQGFGASLMYTTLANARHFAGLAPAKVSIIIVRLKEGVNKEDAMAQVNTLFPNLRAWDAQKLQQSTVKEILISSNMGMSFGTLVIFAMISGFFIIGLTLYSSALDRIKDYGTLKAIGARNNYVNKLIVAQAFLYALIGYAIAMCLLFGFKTGVAKSGLIINISIPFALFLLFITLIIAIGGSLFAVRKIAKLEPASVF